MFKQYLRKLYVTYRQKKQQLHLLHLQPPAYVHYTASFSFHRKINIGKYTRIGRQCHLDGEGGITIGDGTILAPRVVILTSSHRYKDATTLPYGIDDDHAPVVIGRGCWIGWGAMIRPGITIGDGAVVAMGAVVAKDVQAGEVVGGNPAQVIATRAATERIAQMVAAEQYFLKEVIEKKLVRKGRNDNVLDHLVQ